MGNCLLGAFAVRFALKEILMAAEMQLDSARVGADDYGPQDIDESVYG